MEKLQKNSKSSEASASETFAFPVEQEEQVPQWARELQKDVDALSSRLDVTDEEDTEMYAVQTDRKFEKKDRPICDICKKTGHIKASCYQRVCSCCGGKGHDEEGCPSKRSSRNKKFHPKQNNHDRR